MFKKFIGLIAGLGLALTLWTGAGYAYDVPAYEGPVNDYAQILANDFESELETELSSIAAASTGAELAVVTIENLQGETVESVAQQFFDQWQIGKEKLDNGVLLLAAMEERQLRIQTGYGVEPVITDAEAGRIIRNEITPAFREEKYEAGIEAGVTAILDQFESSPGFTPSIDPLNKSERLRSGFMTLFWVTFLTVFASSFFIYFVAWLGRSKAWWPGGLVGLGLGLLLGLIPGIFFGLFGLFLDYILSKNYKKWKLENKTTDWKKTWGGFYHSSGSSGFGSSSSGSSFGGGSSGGGGASGSW
jgi:uncharacterized protein